MDGYRYWVERHKLLIELAQKKERLAELPLAARPAVEAELEREFRERLDRVYGEARGEFEGSRPGA